MTTAPEAAASQREVDILRGELQRLDDHGTRGVGAIQSQLVNMVKDLAELKANVDTRFDAHQRVHDQDHADRISGRRWLIGTAIAGIGAMAGMFAMLWDILRHVHG
jgi:hypothetical protein